MVTIKDIARKLNISVTTVSRALNNYTDISEETKDLVRATADELGYRPNTLARRLQKRHTDTLGLILPTFGPRFSDPFFSEFIAGVGNMAAQHGYDLSVSTRPPGEPELQAYREMVDGRKVDGFILVRTRCEDSRVDYLRAASFPFVAFGRLRTGNDFPFVDEDGETGMHQVVDYLFGLGHRRIGVIAASTELTFACHRLSGIRRRLDRHGNPLDESLVRTGDLTHSSGYNQGKSLLDLPDPPTAIIACNDLMAHGAMSAAQGLGLQVGLDISITGFDDIPISENSHPPLTTLHQPIYAIGRQVCEMLIRRLVGTPLANEQVILVPSLVVRGSCGPVPPR